MDKLRTAVLRRFSDWYPASELPFMLFLTFVFAFIYALTIISQARMREPLLLVIFTPLFLLHIGLHWSIMWWLKNKFNIWLYLILQTAIVFILSSITASIGPLIGLYLGLIGVSVGILGSARRIVAGVVGVLAVSAFNYYLITRGTGMVWWVLVVAPMTIFVIIYVVLYSRQTIAREKAQRLALELETANRTLTDYADRIEDLTLTNERQRMARELHDTLAQGLAGLVLQLEAADSHLAGGRPERAQTIVQQAMARARGTLAESRRAIDGLRREPPGDLMQAIPGEVEHFISETGLPCALEISLPEPLPEPVRDFILRAVAEGLTNIARHAQARHARVAIRPGDKSLELEISDDGQGFDPVREAERPGHYGLTGLRERARQVGGRLEIESTIGKGTTVKVKIPLSNPKDESAFLQ